MRKTIGCSLFLVVAGMLEGAPLNSGFEDGIGSKKMHHARITAPAHAKLEREAARWIQVIGRAVTMPEGIDVAVNLLLGSVR